MLIFELLFLQKLRVNMKQINYTLLIITTLLLTACKGIPLGNVSSSNTHDETIIVKNHKTECRLYNAAERSLCIQYHKKGDSAWLIESSDLIKGFSYDWGYEYELEVEVEDLDPAPQDASDKKYTFKSLVRKTPAIAGGEFELSVSIYNDSNANEGSIIKRVLNKTNIFKIYNQKEIECSLENCAKIDTAISENKGILFGFKHPASPSEPLFVNEVLCTATKDKFAKTKANGGCF